MRAAVQHAYTRLLVTLSLTVVVLALAGEPQVAALALGGAAAIMIAGVVRHAALTLVTTERMRGIGGRSREHRQVLSRMPAPQHPDTVGRARPRAPGAMASVA
ncbi:hypothetical protein [Marisediminicola sp. LYQ134]|uniref:hypothetical protein n=1 Tax=Marisediminicola sp. LYQ134 TaxID=3391061 RepID=UPI0039838859